MNLQYQIDDLIRSLGIYSLKICEGFGIPEHVVHAPIYTGYQKYYSVDKTDGEHTDVNMKDFVDKMNPKF